ncbi:SprT family protein [Sulfoacidibacillus thermotolerans]|uniref:SprT family protein n=1 Tax=Sulfoacidibacillus thermotolerans TaxID=1765684 RepID=A0A2U3DCN7_SULT2|nr:SprT family protein [Sulfoacidibacillus thermotolerans]PWI59050.1 SprT family protein [Sulfoacidibacillus thermotolerans]
MRSIEISSAYKLPTNEAELHELVATVSQTEFGLPFLHQCRFNARLRTSGGRYLLSTHDLEFNPRYMNMVGYEGLLGTIRHELCHYHLHLAGKGYRHRDADFKRLLAKVGGARYAEPSSLKRNLPIRYEYVCTQCQTHYTRRRKLDLRRYVCGICRSKLKLVRDRLAPEV